MGIWNDELLGAKFLMEAFPLSPELFELALKSDVNMNLPEKVRLEKADFTKLSQASSKKQMLLTLREILYGRCREHVAAASKPSETSDEPALKFDFQEVLLSLLSIIFQGSDPSQFEDCGNSLVVDLSDLKRIIKQLFHTFDNVFGLGGANPNGPTNNSRSREAVSHVAKYLIGESTLNNIQEYMPDSKLKPKFEIFLKIIQNAQK